MPYLFGLVHPEPVCYLLALRAIRMKQLPTEDAEENTFQESNESPVNVVRALVQEVKNIRSWSALMYEGYCLNFTVDAQ